MTQNLRGRPPREAPRVSGNEKFMSENPTVRPSTRTPIWLRSHPDIVTSPSHQWSVPYLGSSAPLSPTSGLHRSPKSRTECVSVFSPAFHRPPSAAQCLLPRPWDGAGGSPRARAQVSAWVRRRERRWRWWRRWRLLCGGRGSTHESRGPAAPAASLVREHPLT